MKSPKHIFVNSFSLLLRTSKTYTKKRQRKTNNNKKKRSTHSFGGGKSIHTSHTKEGGEMDTGEYTQNNNNNKKAKEKLKWSEGED